MKLVKINVLLLLFITANRAANAQTSDYTLTGLNSWVLHTPDDGRTTMFIAPGVNNTNFNWAASTQFMNNGDVHFSGNAIMAGSNSWNLHTPDDGRKILYLTPGAYGTGWNYANSTKFLGDGRVMIGNTTTPAGYNLYVQTGILTEKVKVAVYGTAQWADHVFHQNYQLMPLEQVEQFIQQNKHLPNVPSAAEMVKEGNDLGKTDAKLLEKIEELTLYMIQLKKENEAFRAMLNKLDKKVEQAMPQK